MTAADAASTSSGQTRKTTSTTLTVRQSNVMNAIQPPVSKPSKSSHGDPPSKPPLPSSTPKTSNTNANNASTTTKPSKTTTTAIVPAGKNGSIAAATTSFYAPDAPLPSARQLSKVMCRIVDGDAYTKNDALVALQRLHQWALKQDIKFGNALVGIGGIQHVLFFVEDHQTDAKTIASALLLLEALTTPLDDYESKALTNMRQKISQSIVDGQGIELLLHAFEYHGLPKQPNSTDVAARAAAVKATQQERDSLWNTFSSIWNCENGTVVDENTNPAAASIDGLVMSTCGVLGGANSNLARSMSFSSPSKKATDTAILCMKVLSKIVPSAAGAVPDKSAAILSTLVDAIPKLVGTSSLAKQEQEALIASIMSCLVSAVKLSKNTVLKNAKNNNAVSKQVIDITVKMMREFPHHSQIVCDGCLVLQGVCPHLQKSERKRYGVVAALGAVVASDNMMDKKVKEIADAILEEQFK